MATHNITINKEGTPTRKEMGVIQREDIVSFFVVGSDSIILCLPVEVFGAERIEIPAGDSAAVRVKPNAPFGTFKYWSCNPADASGLNCSDIIKQDRGDSGTGSVGGGAE